MRYKIYYTPKAQADLDAIWYYIAVAKAAPQTAGRVITRITTAIDRLTDIGGGYKLYPDEPWASQGVHIFSVRNYSVLYRLGGAGKRIEILRIIVGGRDHKSVSL